MARAARALSSEAHFDLQAGCDEDSSGAGLDHERDQGFHPCAVRRIFVREMPHHERFFLPQLDPEAREAQHQSSEAARPAHRQCCGEEHHQDCRVDRVAHVTIRPACHERVILFERDDGAPVRANRPPRPDGEDQPCGAQDGREDFHRQTGRHDAPRERIERNRPEEQREG